MTRGSVLLLLGVALVAIGSIRGVWFLPFVWLGVDFVVLGVAHIKQAHNLFGKRPDGSLPLWRWVLFLPLLLYTSAVWRLSILLSREPAQNKVADELVIGRRLLPNEVQGEFVNYIDLTAEFQEPRSIRQLPAYRSFPILDASAPDPEALNQMLARLPPGRTFIHCAQGHGRTGLFTLAFMLRSGAIKSVEEGLAKLQSVRPRIRLSGAQRQCIDTFATTHKKANCSD
jgi:hypothetical protein